jgi:glutamate--cysteine ligase catalytic subunit
MKLLQSESVDERLAYHISSLFVRDPIPTYDYELDQSQFDNKCTTAHFENLQSTNWNSMRFKPPPSSDSKIGWRVEFRTMDIQLTDVENSAFIVVLGLIFNVINHYNVNFAMPISLIDENMDRAHKRNAYIKEKFWFRTDIVP